MNKASQELANISFEGIVIPYTWYNHPLLRVDPTKTHPDGKLNILALIILAELVDWYRPVYGKFEENSKLAGLKSKFSSPVYIIDYPGWSAHLGVPEREISSVCQFLESRNLVRMKFKETYEYTNESGEKCYFYNVTLIEPIVETIKSLQKVSSIPKESISKLAIKSSKDLWLTGESNQKKEVIPEVIEDEVPDYKSNFHNIDIESTLDESLSSKEKAILADEIRRKSVQTPPRKSEKPMSILKDLALPANLAAGLKARENRKESKNAT